MVKAGQLEEQIQTLNEERAQLSLAETNQVALASTVPAIKPEAQHKGAKLMARAEFDRLTVQEQGKFIRSGGKTQD